MEAYHTAVDRKHRRKDSDSEFPLDELIRPVKRARAGEAIVPIPSVELVVPEPASRLSSQASSSIRPATLLGNLPPQNKRSGTSSTPMSSEEDPDTLSSPESYYEKTEEQKGALVGICSAMLHLEKEDIHTAGHAKLVPNATNSMVDVVDSSSDSSSNSSSELLSDLMRDFPGEALDETTGEDPSSEHAKTHRSTPSWVKALPHISHEALRHNRASSSVVGEESDDLTSSLEDTPDPSTSEEDLGLETSSEGTLSPAIAASSSPSCPAPKPPTATDQYTPTPLTTEALSALQSRLDIFIPKLRAANETLEAERREGRLEKRNIEILENEDGGDGGGDGSAAKDRKPYIEMDLQLGVLEEKKGGAGEVLVSEHVEGIRATDGKDGSYAGVKMRQSPISNECRS